MDILLEVNRKLEGKSPLLRFTFQKSKSLWPGPNGIIINVRLEEEKKVFKSKIDDG